MKIDPDWTSALMSEQRLKALAEVDSVEAKITTTIGKGKSQAPDAIRHVYHMAGQYVALNIDLILLLNLMEMFPSSTQVDTLQEKVILASSTQGQQVQLKYEQQ